MTDLRERFSESDRLPVPDLWEEASSRTPGPLPRGDHARRVVTIAVAIAVAAGGIGLARGLLFPSRASAPGATPPNETPSSEPTEDPGGPASRATRYEFVTIRVVSSTRDRLVLEGPIGLARWTLNANCDVTGFSIRLGRNTGGFGGSGCGGDAYLGSGGAGGLAVDETFYQVVVGQAIPQKGYRVRVVLGDGRSVEVTPLEGLWMVVLGPAEDVLGGVPDEESWPARAELLDAGGNVISTQEYPDWVYATG
jgi:hypothetical protein